MSSIKKAENLERTEKTEKEKATGSNLASGQNKDEATSADKYDVFADGDEGVAATVVNSFLKKAGRKERARSGSLLV